MIDARLEELKNKLNETIDHESQYPIFKTAKDWIEEWDFKNHCIDLYTHKIHDYPAMFIPQLARKVIQEFTNEGDTILDIFSGSGTTVLESKILNRNGIGIDLNPLAILISQVKTTPINEQELLSSYELFWKNYLLGNYKIQHFSNIEFWFSSNVIEVFSKIYCAIEKIGNDDLKNLYKIAFSSIIRKLSHCKHSGFKMHKDKDKENIEYTEEQIFNSFHQSFCKVAKGVKDFSKINNTATTKIIIGDSRIYDIKEKVDLIFTSPPYGDSKTTVAYGQFSRLQSQWLGLIGENEKGHVDNIDKELLGGIIKNVDLDDEIIYKSQALFQAITTLKSLLDMNDKKNIERVKDVLSFYIDLNQAMKIQSQKLKLNKYAVFVVASRTVKNVQLNTDLIIAELGREYDLELESIFYRVISNKRMPHSVSATNIRGETCPTMDRESIVILKKKNNVRQRIREIL